MFGIDTTVLAFIVLAGLSAGAVAYALLFSRIESRTTPAGASKPSNARKPTGR
jgi:hypothetical protein